jgi:Domain of unknown function (DUF4331)
MSSHREAPEISKHPAADSTDLYAFVSPKPGPADTVTLIANYIPLEAPDGGPNFYEFSDDVLYQIHIDNTGNGVADISYQFRFHTVNNIPSSFLYNDGPITSLTPPSPTSSWNRQQTYTLTRVDHNPHNRWRGSTTVLGSGLLSPPCNIGPLSTPNYATALAAPAVHSVSHGGFSATVFAGQRAEGFYVDLGALFDLGDLRGFAGDHVGGPAAGLMNGMPGVNSTADVNVHSLALQVPTQQLTRATPSGPSDPAAVIGVWTTASRQRVWVAGNDGDDEPFWSGPWTQLSRLGNPLTNELIIGIADKDRWNRSQPLADGNQFLHYFAHPLLPQLLPALYPGVFPNLAAYNSNPANARPDIEAIFLTGIPAGVITPAPTFTNYNGTGVKADLLRLNTAIPPASSPNSLGLLGGDVAGFPNGRRVFDDVATIALRAVAGATLGFVDHPCTADAAAGIVDFGLTNGATGTDLSAKGTENYLSTFPYLGVPYAGYSNPSVTPVSSPAP